MTTNKPTSSHKNPKILLIHGFRGSHDGLADIKTRLESAGYEVFAPDIPPFGNSKPLETYTPDSYAKFIADYILENNLSHPILAGHSMGSIITAAVSEKYPELIADKIIFLAPISAKPPRIIACMKPFLTFLPNKFIGFCSTQFMIIDRTDIKNILHTTYRCGEFHNEKSDLAGAADFSSSYCINSFAFDNKTSLFLAGEKDRLATKSQTRKTAESHRNSSAVFLKNTGHLLNYEKPEAVATEIIKFLGS